jgi:deoxyribose-phosphate aldolase
VTRFGTSATATILDDVAARAEGATASGGTDESSY